MLTCKEASHLVSERLDRKLSQRERIALRFHVWMCNNCRRFERQLQFLRITLRQGIQDGQMPKDKPLSPEGRDRIRQGLRAHSQDHSED